MSGQQDFRNRFRIVKVETTEPLKRGRWTCFDFVDKPAAKEKQPEQNGDKTVKPAATGPPPAAASARPAGGSRPASVAARPVGGGESSKPAPTQPPAPVESRPPPPDLQQQQSAPASGAVSEERELDGKGHLYRQSNSVPPEATMRSTGGGYTAGASFHQPPHSISITTQPNLTSLSQETY